MDVVESNQQPLSLEVSGFVQTCMHMASRPREGKAPSPPGEAVILGNSRKSRTWQVFEEITSADKWKPLNSSKCREDRR